MSYHRHQAIYNTHPLVKSISPRGPLDANSNIVVIDESLVTEEIERLKIFEGLIRLRKERTKLLQQSDWMANSDVVMTDEWRAYRQALRDLPETQTPALDDNGNLINVEWPTPPGETSVS